MISTSDGSRPDPRQFLLNYAADKEQGIRDLQSERMLAVGDQALKGKEDLLTIKGKAASGIIQV